MSRWTKSPTTHPQTPLARGPCAGDQIHWPKAPVDTKS